MLPGARQGVLAAAERLQHTGMKDVVLWVCQGPGCSYVLEQNLLFESFCSLIKDILSLMALY